MGIWMGMKWVAREGTGLGSNRRFGRIVLFGDGRGKPRYRIGEGLWRQFIASATAAVQCYGPSWARWKLGGRPVGVWGLVLVWVIPPLLLAMLAVHRVTLKYSRHPVASVVGTRSRKFTFRFYRFYE